MGKYLFLILLFLMLFVGCSQGSDETDIITEKIDEELGISPYIPKVEFPIGTVIVSYDFKVENEETVKGEPKSAVIEYLVSKENSLDEETKEEWEESEVKKVIYGELYTGQSAIQMTISKDAIGEISGADQIDIDGHEVQYLLVQEDVDLVIMAMDFNDYGYTVQYSLVEGESEEDAISFLKDIINNTQ
ncbi:hypothetical protein QGM71_08395 [Virgibacillus sp. C22-A2]|uniref:DUF4367 domain-containing protein n=1 Tax=Virgibacillus tibetensis TaxID=3042313 RepID=A0ABU6KEK8_9BACI|nr:hypothetical protein [Virgibacillus sp. C22-A2]